jgi:transposase-like protein
MKEPEALKEVVKYCYYCNSSNNRFAYFNNSDEGQPRYRCHDCSKLFTFGSESNRPKGRKYGKKKGVDPEEIRVLPRQCPNPSCEKTMDTPFKYYNNNCKTQLCFKCLSCKQLFFMRIITDGIESQLVHSTSRAKSIKPPKITKGSNRPRKSNHVQKGLCNVDMLPNEMPEYHVAHSMEANNGGMEDINTSACDCETNNGGMEDIKTSACDCEANNGGMEDIKTSACHCGSCQWVGFNDQAPYNYGLLKERTMIHHQIHHSHYETSPSMETDEINQAPMCSTSETSLDSQPWDIEAPVMANDVVDNMDIPLEDCEMAMEGVHDAFVTGFMEGLLDKAEMPQDCTYLAELEKDLADAFALEFEKDSPELEKDLVDAFALEFEKDSPELEKGLVDAFELEFEKDSPELEKDLVDAFALQFEKDSPELENDLVDAFAVQFEKDSAGLEKDLVDAFALEFEKDSAELEKDLVDAFAVQFEKDSPELEKDLADAFALEFEKDSPEDDEA